MDKPFLLMNDNDIFTYLFGENLSRCLFEEEKKNLLNKLGIDKNSTRRYLIYNGDKIHLVKKYLYRKLTEGRI